MSDEIPLGGFGEATFEGLEGFGFLFLSNVILQESCSQERKNYGSLFTYLNGELEVEHQLRKIV